MEVGCYHSDFLFCELDIRRDYYVQWATAQAACIMKSGPNGMRGVLVAFNTFHEQGHNASQSHHNGKNESKCDKSIKTYLDTVGRTPLVRVNRVLPPNSAEARVLLKLEMQNPGGSIKDRIAKSIIDDAEKKGLLRPGGTVVEYTSGNTGIGLAMICAAKGYKCIIIMPQLPFCRERFVTCRQFGADVHLVSPASGFLGLKTYTERLVSTNPGYFLANQFYNESNPEIHYKTTGPEIWEQSGGKVDYFVAGVGTGGTLVGAGKYLKEVNAQCKVICVEPTESRAHVGAPHNPHTILGIGAGVATHFLTQLDPSAPLKEGPRGHIADFLHCTSEEAVQWAKKLARTEGIMVGPSSGATMKVACDIAARPEAAGKTIVVMCASHGVRYSAHPLWEDINKEADIALTPKPEKDAEVLQWKPR